MEVYFRRSFFVSTFANENQWPAVDKQVKSKNGKKVKNERIMEIKATVEQMSAPINCKYKTESGVEREFSYLEVVLNDGLNRIYGETTGPLNAQDTAKKVKIGDNVVALV
ncbi:MAG: hypothetical protein J6W63_04275, partial [Treponema sp.]|nr:hypothetical protein [Treponema sp.]